MNHPMTLVKLVTNRCVKLDLEELQNRNSIVNIYFFAVYRNLLIGKVFQWYKNCSATCFMLLTSCSTSGGAPTRVTSNRIGSLSGCNDSGPINKFPSLVFNGYKDVGRGWG